MDGFFEDDEDEDDEDDDDEEEDRYVWNALKYIFGMFGML